MLLAVLQRRAGLDLLDCDVFVNVAGGVSVVEPGADLAVAMAIASGFRDRPFSAETVAIGEIGLGGEVRAVGRMEQRLTEAHRLGFKRAVVPQSCRLQDGAVDIELQPVKRLGQALDVVGGA
jgi:DNA repair protein RadA/Sms